MHKQFQSIIDFIKIEKINNLILIGISEEVNIFYIYLVKYFNHKLNGNYLLTYKNDIHTNIGNHDFFQQQTINIIDKISAKEIQKYLGLKNKKIIFLDYKNFKKYKNDYISVNTYNYKNDIDFFINNELKNNNINLKKNILNLPEHIEEEIKKYTLNSKNYPILDQNIDLISLNEIRKEIYTIKNTNILDLQRLFEQIKKEVVYKKFNFLTY